MKLRSLVVTIVALGPLSAYAQATRTWVSGVGDDANPCSRTAPCKTWAGAISKTAAGGEIDALDPGGFGAVTITKSITLDGSGTFGSILVAATNAIVVSAGVGDVVVLRGLSLQGISRSGTAGLNGVRMTSASKLRVEGCLINGFGSSGIKSEAGGSVVVEGTTVVETGEAAISLALATTATVSRSHLVGGVIGVLAADTAQATLRDTVVTGFSAAGVQATGTAVVNFDGGLVAESLVGIDAGAGTTVRLSDVMLSHDGTGLVGSVTSFGNNRLSAGNGADGSPATTLPLQ